MSKLRVNDSRFRKLLDAITRRRPSIDVGILGSKAALRHVDKQVEKVNGRLAKAKIAALNVDPKKAASARKRIDKLQSEAKLLVADAAKAPATIAEIGAFHELGTATIPKRSFLFATIAQHDEAIRKRLRAAAKSLFQMDGKTDALASRLGVLVVGLVKKRIASGIAPALKVATVDRKGSSKPLIDTGLLRSSILFRVRATPAAKRRAAKPRPKTKTKG